MRTTLRALYLALEMFVIILVGVTTLAFVLDALGAPWWTHFLAGGAWGYVAWRWINWRVKREVMRKMVNVVMPVSVWVDTGNPLDPRGDGTLRPGDPMFDNVLGPLRRGELPDGVVVFGAEGVYELHIPPKDGHISRPDGA